MSTLAIPPLAFDVLDIERANREWGCNCGPTALAAALGWTLDTVRPYLGDFERRGYMGTEAMRRAIENSGYRIFDTPYPVPAHGLARIQWGGSWLNPGVHRGAAASRTHWVATKQGVTGWVFDVNSLWTPLEQWERETVPRIVASIKGADGTWSFTHCWEVRKKGAKTS